MKTPKHLTERALVNKLIKALQANSHRVYVHVDRDSGSQRHTSSGWDFLLAADGRVVFCEAKKENGNLSDWQKFTAAQIIAARSRFVVVRFSADGKFFCVAGGKDIEISDACFKDFIQD